MKTLTTNLARNLSQTVQCLLLGVVLLTGTVLYSARAQTEAYGYSGVVHPPAPKMVEAHTLVAEGEKLLTAGKLDAAIIVLKRAYETYPRHADTSCPPLAEAYVRKGQLREAEKTYRLAFAWRSDPTMRHFGSVEPLVYARYALLEIRLQNWQEAFLAYEIARKGMSVEYQRENMPIFDNQLQKKELEAALRLIVVMEGAIPQTKAAKRVTEIEKILSIYPKFALAHYELASIHLNDKYLDDIAGYRKAAKPHYEAVVKYGSGEIKRLALWELQHFQNKEQNSRP